MPYKKIKNNKYKQKRSNWVTNGIIKSIQYRDKLYKSSKQTLYNTPSYFTLKQNLKVYNRILRPCIREAKSNFYHKQFQKHTQNSKNTWNLINDIVKRKHTNFLPDSFI